MVSVLVGGVSVRVLAQDPYEGMRERWLEAAEAAKPELKYQTVTPVAVVEPVKDPVAFQGWRYDRVGAPDSFYAKNFKEVETITLDFGKHLVGYFSFHTKTLSRCLDAPVRLKFTFGEVPAELNTPFDPWAKNRLGRAWMQDETVTLAVNDSTMMKPVVFEDAELASILKDIAAFHQMEVVYRKDASKHVRLYFTWDKKTGIDDIINTFNKFERIHITRKDSKLIVE